MLGQFDRRVAGFKRRDAAMEDRGLGSLQADVDDLRTGLVGVVDGEEFHVGKLPYQVLWEVIDEKHKNAKDPVERRHLEAYRDYLRNFELAAKIAILDDEDQAILRESIKCNLADLEQVIPSIRIRQAWKSHEASERIAMEE